MTYDAKVWDLCLAFLGDVKDLTEDERGAWADKMAL